MVPWSHPAFAKPELLNLHTRQLKKHPQALGSEPRTTNGAGFSILEHALPMSSIHLPRSRGASSSTLSA